MNFLLLTLFIYRYKEFWEVLGDHHWEVFKYITGNRLVVRSPKNQKKIYIDFRVSPRLLALLFLLVTS